MNHGSVRTFGTGLMATMALLFALSPATSSAQAYRCEVNGRVI
jgi:hypothetical protein